MTRSENFNLSSVILVDFFKSFGATNNLSELSSLVYLTTCSLDHNIDSIIHVLGIADKNPAGIMATNDPATEDHMHMSSSENENML